MKYEFKEGQKVMLFFSGKPSRPMTIDKISPKRGDITLKDHTMKFRQGYGSEINTEKWSTYPTQSIKPWTQELQDKADRRAEVRRARNNIDKVSKIINEKLELSDDDAIKLWGEILPILEKYPRKEKAEES